MLVFGVISPHPPLIIPEIGGKDIERVKRTVAALEIAAEKLAAAKPERLLIISPNEGYGFEVPMHYLGKQLPADLETEMILVTEPSYEHYYEWGKQYGDACDRSDRRTAVIASADLSHVLKPEGPYGYHSAGPLLDKLVIKAVQEKDAAQLLRLDPGFLERAAECGLRSILFLMGAFEGKAYEAEVLSYEGPFGVGYLVATFSLS
ncbi:AmmeMemoRadiSam system protein B [Trichococcus ilyis]|jgi:aromatic ring-opening dioxygenase LigB subunit|uniref:AmmeMemoRadiSam system protein B n=1 Tax=Trichococcus ilyis TaxID=640938 RepID=A0A143Z6G0_9LACT|nr:AmmeMemoRadiSam system protein B [Trichococcus ilyis]CZR08699.1 ammememosam b: ammememoradisam system protein b [Trichococcus ilyis]SEJ80320.1 AmmeMemoRadiSam system protein B [Trichococcus ilyis]